MKYKKLVATFLVSSVILTSMTGVSHLTQTVFAQENDTETVARELGKVEPEPVVEQVAEETVTNEPVVQETQSDYTDEELEALEGYEQKAKENEANLQIEETDGYYKGSFSGGDYWPDLPYAYTTLIENKDTVRQFEVGDTFIIKVAYLNDEFHGTPNVADIVLAEYHTLYDTTAKLNSTYKINGVEHQLIESSREDVPGTNLDSGEYDKLLKTESIHSEKDSRVDLEFSYTLTQVSDTLGLNNISGPMIIRQHSYGQTYDTSLILWGYHIYKEEVLYKYKPSVGVTEELAEPSYYYYDSASSEQTYYPKEINGYEPEKPELKSSFKSATNPQTTGTGQQVFFYQKKTNPTEPVKTGDLTVEYVDETGKELSPVSKSTIDVGKEYTVKAKDIQGYTLISNDTVSGKMTDGGKKVVFVYKENEKPTPIIEYGVLEIRYVDEKGNYLADTEFSTLKVGNEFNAKALEFKDYELVGESSQSGTMTKDGKTVIFTYKQIEKADPTPEPEKPKPVEPETEKPIIPTKVIKKTPEKEQEMYKTGVESSKTDYKKIGGIALITMSGLSVLGLLLNKFNVFSKGKK